MSTPYTLRAMRNEDIPQVVAIDKLSFTLPWSEKTYAFEIENSRVSHLAVLEWDAPLRIWQRLWQPLRRAPAQRPLVGYVASWIIAGEVHISTIAVHPTHRGHGLGELLLAGMLLRAYHFGGQYSVLEVRESNLTARALYEKYGYRVVGRREGYYRDNQEDALLMQVAPLDAAYRQLLERHLAALRARTPYTDRFTQPQPNKRSV